MTSSPICENCGQPAFGKMWSKNKQGDFCQQELCWPCQREELIRHAIDNKKTTVINGKVKLV